MLSASRGETPDTSVSRLGWAASTALVILWFTATLTLINPNACFLYSNDTLIEQPAEIGYLTLRHTRQATAFIAEAAAAPRR